MVALVASDQVENFARSVLRAYHGATGIQPVVNAVRAAAGAGLVATSPPAEQAGNSEFRNPKSET